MARVGRPLGGIPPRRITHWLGDRGFGRRFEPDRFAWYRDRWGSELRLNPFYFLDRSVIAFGSYDDRLHRFLEAHIKPRMVCFDLGANIGEMSLHMARLVGPGGRVYAFEPAPRVRARLEENVRRNGLGDVVRVVPVALSDHEGTATMSVAPEAVANQGEGTLLDAHGRGHLVETCQVALTTIDAFVQREGIGRVDFLKVDIQGAEPLMLDGGKRVFGELSPDVMMEISPGDLRASGRSGAELIRQLEAYGYGVHEYGEQGAIGRRIRPDDPVVGVGIDNAFCTKSPAG